MPHQKTLYILRHAKAEATAPHQDDHDRRLVERGVEAALMMGKHLARQHIVPDKALCSTAERACRSWAYVQEAWKHPPPVEYSEKLYLASANEILSLLAATDEQVRRLMIVGHNPGLHQLALKLAARGDAALLEALALKLPTCAFVAIDLGEIFWRDVVAARGELVMFIIGNQESGIEKT